MSTSTFLRHRLPGVLVAAGSAVAQAQPQPLPQTAPVIEEVVVTAQKRQQSLQDVAIAVTAFSGETLENQGITQSNQIGAQVPNLAIATNGGPDGAPVFYLRGVGLNDFSSANSGPIGVYQDEVYLKNLWAQNFALFDLSRVEVLRGPQGTLFGRNTTAGALLFQSRGPSDTFNGRLGLKYASFDTVTTDLALGGPLADGVSGRMALQYTATAGPTENRFSGHESPDTEKWSYRGALRFDLGEDLSLRAKYQGGRKRGTSGATKARGLLDPGGGQMCSVYQVDNYRCASVLGRVDTDDDKQHAANDFEPGLDTQYNALMLRLDWQLSDAVALTAISAYDRTEARLGEDADGTVDDILTVAFDDRAEQLSQELRLAGTGDVSNWVLGVYYLYDQTEGESHAGVLGELAPFVLLPEAVTGISDADTQTILDATATFEQVTDSYAVFGQYERDLGDALRFTGGLRYTHEKIEMNDYQTVADFPGLPLAPGVRVPLTGVPLVNYSDSIRDDNVSGKIGLDYAFTENLLVYGTVSTAFKAGGFNSALLTDSLQARPFDVENVIAYELGLKSTVWDGRLRFNAAAFYYDYQDAQVFTNITSSTGTPARLVVNAPKSEMQGFEAELVALPAAGLTVQMGLGYVDAQLNEFRTEEQLPNGDILLTDLSGNTTPVTPKWSFSTLLSYQWHINAGTLEAAVDYNWQDAIHFSTDNVAGLGQSAYGLVNARQSFTSADLAWELAVWARNLTDEEYRTWSSDVSDFGVYSDYWGVPRSVGVDFTYHL